jgi:hypothetical protein
LDVIRDTVGAVVLVLFQQWMVLSGVIQVKMVIIENVAGIMNVAGVGNVEVLAPFDYYHIIRTSEANERMPFSL